MISAVRFSANTAGARVQLVAFGRGLRCGGAFERRDLRRRAVAARLPVLALGGDRLQAAVGKLRLAGQRLRFGTHFGDAGAMALDLVAQAGQLDFEIGRRRHSGERLLGCRAAPNPSRRDRWPA